MSDISMMEEDKNGSKKVTPGEWLLLLAAAAGVLIFFCALAVQDDWLCEATLVVLVVGLGLSFLVFVIATEKPQWAYGLVALYFTGFLVYQVVLHPFWSEGLAPKTLKTCDGREVTLPALVPRSVLKDNQPLRAAQIRLPREYEIGRLDGGYIVETENPSLYKIWVPPNFPDTELSLQIRRAGDAFKICSPLVKVETKAGYFFKRLLALIFGINLASIAGIVSGGKIYYHQKDIREEYRTTKEKMEKAPPVERALAYFGLWFEGACRRENKGLLRRWWRSQWTGFSQQEQWMALQAVLSSYWLPNWHAFLRHIVFLKVNRLNN